MSRKKLLKWKMRKRHKTRNFENPYFRRTREVPWKFVLIISASLFTVLIISSFFFGSEQFEISTISIRGNETISTETLRANVEDYLSTKSLIFFQSSNKFLFDKSELQNHLEKYYFFEYLEVVINKNTIDINLKEKASQLLWKTKDQVFLVDLQGVATREITVSEQQVLEDENISIEGGLINPISLMPIFRDMNDIEIAIGEQILTSEEIENMFRFHEHLKIQSIQVIETQIDRLAGKWMGVKTGLGYRILFDASGDIDGQANHLEVLLRETINNPEQLDYIDLRFGDHVYFK